VRKYGDVVLLVVPAPGHPKETDTGTIEVNAVVLQSLVHPLTDKEGNFLKDAEGNFSEPVEHLTVAYAEPGKGVQVMSGQQVQGAMKFLFSVTPLQPGHTIGFRDSVVVKFVPTAVHEASEVEPKYPVPAKAATLEELEAEVLSRGYSADAAKKIAQDRFDGKYGPGARYIHPDDPLQKAPDGPEKSFGDKLKDFGDDIGNAVGEAFEER
jgi:hypothetical protein